MKKKVFTLNGKKYYSEEEYIKARNQFLNYQNEKDMKQTVEEAAKKGSWQEKWYERLGYNYCECYQERSGLIWMKKT